MKVLVACETSGAVRDAFRALGHDAMSCDILPTDIPGPHYQGDVRDILNNGWDLLIAHPPCTYLCSSGMHWTTRGLRDPQLTEDALDLVRLLMAAPIPRIAIENPVGCISTHIRPADQYIHPHQFDDASKKTGLWLKGLPPLRPTQHIAPRLVNGKPRWSNQTDGGQNKEPPSADRWKIRSKTYEGIATAMATQWGGQVPAAYQSPVQTLCQCTTCGYEWPHGQSGAHRCQDTLLARIADLERQLATSPTTPEPFTGQTWNLSLLRTSQRRIVLEIRSPTFGRVDLDLTEAHFAGLLFNTAAVPVPVTRHTPTRTQIHP